MAMITLSNPFPATSQTSTASGAFINNLMPQPAQVESGAGTLAITSQFSASATQFHDSRLDDAIGRALRQLRQKTGISLAMEPMPPVSGATLAIAVKGAGEQIQSVDENESYSLEVTSDRIQINSQTVVGAMRALATLVQLVQPSGEQFVLPAVSIHDSPRFPWRGLMIDCGRHFEPIEVLKRTLDGMAAVKLNVFHWHLIDDQGFRIESKIYPQLTARGSDGLFYTQQQAAEIVEYARARGIRVVPEFEMPGHSTAWLVAYPQFASGRAPKAIRREFGVSDYALDPTNPEIYKFIDKFMGEMATIFPDPYFHIGGDETVSPEWKSDPRIQSFMQAHSLKDPDALQAYFNQQILKILEGHHKHMVGWDEILNPALPKDVVVQSWRGGASLIQGAEKGYQGILSAPYYLDAMQPAGKHYLADPLPTSAPLTAEQRKLILGGEVCMWAEQLNERTIDSRVWPRTAAIAERFWSPEQVADVDDMYRRLQVVSLQLEALGLRHLSQEDVGLRELAGTQQIDQLRIFASVLEPASFSERYDQQKTSQLTVLNNFVDAVRPDPPSRYEIDRLTRGFLKDPRTNSVDKEELLRWFIAMDSSVPSVEQLMQHSPLLAKVQIRAQQLPGLSTIAKQALGFLSSGTKAPAGWKQSSISTVEAARKPAGIVRFTFIDPLSSLINAVQE